MRLDASNLLHDGSLAPIVSNQVDESRIHASSHNWLAIVLQCDISTRTMIDVSDRIADNRNGQFEFNTEHIGSLEYSNKAIELSRVSAVS